MERIQVGNPTMTDQRIEALMTGSELFSSANLVRTFMDSKVSTDNIISQLARHSKTSSGFGNLNWNKNFNFTEF